MNDALRDAKSLEAPSWVSARTKAQVVRNLWLAFDYEIQQISTNSFIKCYNDVNSSTMTSEWCHKMSQITMSWFMASWIYGRNDRARRRWSGRLEQSGDADLGPSGTYVVTGAPVYCMLMKFVARGESMDATWCHCEIHWNSMEGSACYASKLDHAVRWVRQWDRWGSVERWIRGVRQNTRCDAHHVNLMI